MYQTVVPEVTEMPGLLILNIDEIDAIKSGYLLIDLLLYLLDLIGEIQRLIAGDLEQLGIWIISVLPSAALEGTYVEAPWLL